jgi:hypothetical protein
MHIALHRKSTPQEQPKTNRMLRLPTKALRPLQISRMFIVNKEIEFQELFLNTFQY